MQMTPAGSICTISQTGAEYFSLISLSISIMIRTVGFQKSEDTNFSLYPRRPLLRYSFGDMPKCCLKDLEKYEYELKPQRSATSASVSPAPISSTARFRR